ncbi:hypothetical protein BSZ39_11745 [Bowdeniella nasicola]|uniref:HTH lysR-type domain-containing protein n=1 Tax=Bowdeniella nasicola TaxID=208480 RepID=A0A1Q5PZG8_9ACTO|nr:LysR family transcriptional regulator [Bowdeniella nasicola]OKL53014.1 hypothetical protein BSZ39_11745 [Bowdeniella nasicola]
MLEIRSFLLIDAIHRTGSLSGAARELGYSQPAVTQQLQQLERKLRTPLIRRIGRTSVLTEAGEVIRRHGEDVLGSVERARIELELIAGLRTGEIRLASFPSAAATIVPVALQQLRQDHPGLTVRLFEMNATQAMRELRKGEIDAAIVGHYFTEGDAGPKPEPDEIWRTIMDEDVYLAVHRGHAAADTDEIPMSSLASERWIAGCPECRRGLLTAAADAGFVPDIKLDTDDYIALQKLVGVGLGVCQLTHLMIAAAHVDSDVVFRRVTPHRIRRVSAVIMDSSKRIPGISELLDTIVDSAANVPLPTP